MTEHPNELLLEIADGAVPPVEARAHLGSCRRCQQTLAALAPLDLGYAWQGVAAELDAPRPGLLERFLVAFGVRPGGAGPVHRHRPQPAPGLAAGQPAGPRTGRPADGAPAGGVGAVGGAAGGPPGGGGRGRLRLRPGVDPAYEAVAATPLSPLQALLVRLAAVLVANTALAGVVDLVLGHGPRAGWLLPMTAASLLAALVASCWTPMAGSAAGMGAWLLVLVAWKASHQPVGWLTGPGAQAAYAVVAAALLVLLIRRMIGEGWALGASGT